MKGGIGKTLRKLRKNKEGVVEPINFAIAMMILIVALCFFMDVLRIGLQMQAISRLSTQCARIVAAQGGIQSSPPSGYPGGAANYITRSAFQDEVSDVARKNGINGQITATYPTSSLDYREKFSVEITFPYEWRMLNAINNWGLPPMRGTYRSRRTGVSEYKYDYNNWKGE